MVLYRTDSNIIRANEWCHVGIIRHDDITTLYVNNEIVDLYGTDDNNVINEIGNEFRYIIGANGIVDDIRIYSNVVLSVDDIYNSSSSNTDNFLVRNLIGDWTFNNQLDIDSGVYKDYSSNNANATSVNSSKIVNDMYEDGTNIQALSLISSDYQYANVYGQKYAHDIFDECSIWSRCKLEDINQESFQPLLSKPHVFKFGTSNNEIYFELNNSILNNSFEGLIHSPSFLEFEIFDLHSNLNSKDGITISNVHSTNYQTMNLYLNGVDGEIYKETFDIMNDENLTLTCSLKTSNINQESSLITHKDVFEFGIRDNALYLKTNMVSDRTPTRVYPQINAYSTVTKDDYFNQLLKIHNDTYIVQTNTYYGEHSPANVFNDNSLTYWCANKNIYDANNNDGLPSAFNKLYLQIIYTKSICINYYELHGSDLPNKWILFGGDSLSNMKKIHSVTNNDDIHGISYSSPKMNSTGMAFSIYRLEFDMSDTIHLTSWKIYGYEHIASISEKNLLDIIHENPNTFELLSQINKKTNSVVNSSVMFENAGITGDVTWKRDNNVFITNSDTGTITLPTNDLFADKPFSLVYAFKNTDVPTIALHDENGADVIKLERFQDKYMLFIESDSYEIQPLLLEHSVFNKLTILYDDIENTYTIHVNGVLHDSINPTLRLQSVIISKIYIDTVQSQIITDVDISPILLSDEELNIRMNTLKLKFSGIHDISEDDVSLIKQIDVGSNIDDVNGYVVFNGGITIDNNDNGIVITPTYLSFDREIHLNINVLKYMIHTGSYILTYEHNYGQFHLKITAFHSNQALLSLVLSSNISDENSLKTQIDLALINYETWYTIKIKTYDNILSVFLNDLLFYVTNMDAIWSLDNTIIEEPNDPPTYTLFGKSAYDRTEGASGVQVDDFILKPTTENDITLGENIDIGVHREQDVLYSVTINSDTKNIIKTSAYTYGVTYDKYVQLHDLLPGTYNIPITLTFQDGETKSYIIVHTVLHEIKFELESTVLTDSKIQLSLYNLYIDEYIDMDDVELYIEYAVFQNFKGKKTMLFTMSLTDNPLELTIHNLLDNTLYYIRGTAWNKVTKQYTICTSSIHTTTLTVQSVDYFMYSEINTSIYTVGETIVDKMFRTVDTAIYAIVGYGDIYDNLKISFQKTSSTPNRNVSDVICYENSDSYIKWSSTTTLDTTSITISTWIKYLSIDNSAPILSIGNNMDEEEIVIKIVDGSTLRLYKTHTSDFISTNVEYYNNTGSLIGLGRWHLLTMTKDIYNDVRVYLDTEPVIKYNLNLIEGDINTKLTNCFNLHQTAHVVCDIWNIYYWDTYLSRNEIAYLYNSPLTYAPQIELKVFPSATFNDSDTLNISDGEYDHGTYIITESSYTSVFRSYKLFDKNYKALHATNPDYMSSSGWISDVGIPQHFTMTLPKHIYVLKYVLYPTQDNAGAHPKSWKLVGVSDDGSDTVLDSRVDVDIAINTLNNMNHYVFEVPLDVSSYNIVKFQVDEVQQQENFVSLAEFELWGKEHLTTSQLWDFSVTTSTSDFTTIGNPNILFENQMLTFTSDGDLEESGLSFELDLTHNLGDVLIDFTCLLNSPLLDNENVTVLKFGDLFDIVVQYSCLAISNQNGGVIKITNTYPNVKNSFRVTITYTTVTDVFNIYINGISNNLEVVNPGSSTLVDIYENSFKCKRVINSKTHHIKFGSISNMFSKTLFNHVYYSIGSSITDEMIDNPNTIVDFRVYFTIRQMDVLSNGFGCTIKEIVITDNSKIDLLTCTLITSSDEYFTTNIFETNVSLSTFSNSVVQIDSLDASTTYYMKAIISNGQDTYTSATISITTAKESTIDEKYSISNTNSNMLFTYDVDNNNMYEIDKWGSIDTSFMSKNAIDDSEYKNSLTINHSNFTPDDDFSLILYFKTVETSSTTVQSDDNNNLSGIIDFANIEHGFNIGGHSPVV